ncbi:hypothetical protein DCS_03051 [Drechmeria coniospora]|uniref:Uncharacterized protein n=1 Tax=Drechmeria coniospora TaxID=98403 RepID=A0A151GXT5_DRECN|nr:hypothetical protein DCS_03051 [Drechmeria coniospora]KYK61906.1 hypothetical protein DCS_03051 [Drechmeria coniospora]
MRRGMPTSILDDTGKQGRGLRIIERMEVACKLQQRDEGWVTSPLHTTPRHAENSTHSLPPPSRDGINEPSDTVLTRSDVKDPAGEVFRRPSFECLLKRRFFYAESFDVDRTSANQLADNRGLYDYGPPGCALQANIVNEWRNHFVVEENMMELDCTAITPSPPQQS